MNQPTFQPRAQEGDSPAPLTTRQPPSNPQLEIIHYEAERYIIVNKPADVRIDGDFKHTVSKLVLCYISNTGFDISQKNNSDFLPRFVHRLDYATSGIILIALSKKAAGVVASQFENRSAKKQYIALLHGHIPIGKKIIFDENIANGLPEGSYHMMIGTETNPGRKALTECIAIGNGFYYGAMVTKVLLIPVTGRRHQLRVHCMHAGFPIVGDATYIEDESSRYEEQFIPPRMMLHAHQLIIGLPPAQQVLYGRKSGIRSAQKKCFVADDPFREDRLPKLSLEKETSLLDLNV